MGKLKHKKILSHRVSKAKYMISTIFMIYKPSMEVYIKHRYKLLSHFDSVRYKIYLGTSVGMIYMYSWVGRLRENKINRTHSIAPHIDFHKQINFHNITYNTSNSSKFCIQGCICISESVFKRSPWVLEENLTMISFQLWRGWARIQTIL